MESSSMVLATILVLAFMVAAGAQGATGLGFSLVAMPVAAMLIDADQVVGTVVRAAVVLDVILVLRQRGSLDVRALQAYAWPALLAVPVGLGVGRVVPPSTLVVLSACACLGMSGWLGAQSMFPAVRVVALSAGQRRPVAAGLVAVGASGSGHRAGFASGLMAASVGMPGPPLALDAMRRLPDASVRNATLAAFFLVADLVAVLSHSGHVGAPLLVGLAVGVVGGATLGLRLQARLAADRLQQAMLVVVAASSGLAIARILAAAFVGP